MRMHRSNTRGERLTPLLTKCTRPRPSLPGRWGCFKSGPGHRQRPLRCTRPGCHSPQVVRASFYRLLGLSFTLPSLLAPLDPLPRVRSAAEFLGECVTWDRCPTSSRAGGAGVRLPGGSGAGARPIGAMTKVCARPVPSNMALNCPPAQPRPTDI